MRATQYIGLHSRAYEFLLKNKAEKICQNSLISSGMCEEGITGSIYSVEPNNLSYGEEIYFQKGDKFFFTEIVQNIAWSSGPMIFTCLLNLFTGERESEWTMEEMEDRM